MATSFTREERVAFEETITAFEDQLTYANTARRLEPLSPQEMVHARDKVWIPAPMIGSSYDGFDQTSNFDGITELAVPVQVGFHKVSPKTVSSKNLRNKASVDNYFNQAKVKLASDVNNALRTRVAMEGSVFEKRTVASTGLEDILLAGAQMTEIGVPMTDRHYMAGVRSAIGMITNVGNRSEATSRSADAYTRGIIADNIAGFMVHWDDQPIRLFPAAGGATTVNGANQYWEPAATQVGGTATNSNVAVQGATNETQNRDNRYSYLAVTAANAASIKPGDAFTIAGVDSVHMISKKDTGQLQTFRVIQSDGAGNLVIAPAIISNGGNTIGGKEYQNVSATPANGAAITWLNTASAEMSPFYEGDGLCLLPGSFAVEPEDGWSVLRATTPKFGLAMTYAKQGNINDLSVKIRMDIDFGTALLNPQFAGVTVFNQI